MARQEPLTEREVREALGLRHRAASLALAEAEAWGLVERVSEPRRVGRRGPAGAAYLAVGDHWRWFGRVVAERKVREGDPIVAVLEQKAAEAAAAVGRHPDDAELAALRDWLASFLVFVRLFDRAVGLVPQLEPRELERSLRLLGRVPDDDDPAPVRPPRRPRRRRRPGPGRGAVAALADGRASRDEADVRGRPHRRPLSALASAAIAVASTVRSKATTRVARVIRSARRAASGTPCDNRGRVRDSADSNGRRPRGQTGRRPERTQPRGSTAHHDRRDLHLGDQEGPRPDAQGRRHHGRRHARAGQDRRGRRRRRRHGARARPGRHPQGRRRRPHVRPRDDQRDHGRGDHPGHGQGPDRPLRRGPGPRGARRRLHRRVRGPDPGRRVATTSTSTPSRSRSCAAAGTSARRSAGSTRARR